MAFLIVAIAVLVAIGASVVVAWRRTAHGLAAANAAWATHLTKTNRS